jgi:hypothetical protein
MPRPRRRWSVVLGGFLMAVMVLSACGSASTASAPTATATTAAPTPTPGPTIIYQDPLTSPSSGWTNDPAYGCFFGSDGYHVTGVLVGFAGNECIVPTPLALGELYDVDISVQVKQISGPTTQLYGIGTRRDHRFDIEGDGKWTFRACFTPPCKTVVGLTANPAIHTGLGAANTLEMRAVGVHIDFFVNGTKVGQVYDPTASNASGVTLDGSSGGFEFVFSNLKITTAS